MTINWKKYAIILADVALVTYLVLAVTAFNKPDELTNVCGEVRTEIKDDVVKGFLNVDAVKVQLQRAAKKSIRGNRPVLQDPTRPCLHLTITASAGSSRNVCRW